MPGIDLTEDRAKMRALNEWSKTMDWGDDAAYLTREMKGYPNSSYCPPQPGKIYGRRAPSNTIQHYIGNPTKQRKSSGTRRVGNKGSKMPIRGRCSGCHSHIILVDNPVDKNWPLYIGKHIITEWP